MILWENKYSSKEHKSKFPQLILRDAKDFRHSLESAIHPQTTDSRDKPKSNQGRNLGITWPTPNIILSFAKLMHNFIT